MNLASVGYVRIRDEAHVEYPCPSIELLLVAVNIRFLKFTKRYRVIRVTVAATKGHNIYHVYSVHSFSSINQLKSIY